MEFRAPTVAAETNEHYKKYLTKNLQNNEEGKAAFERLLKDLGNTIDHYPDWHPLLVIPRNHYQKDGTLSELYKRLDHTVLFVRGFVTCPYSVEDADNLVNSANELPGINAYRYESVLYSDEAYPVVIEAVDVELEADGTIRSRDALAWCTQDLVKNARLAEVAETWWNLRDCLLGGPHGSRSSLLVNQYTGGHIRKILEALNNSGMFGPIKEWSLGMLSKSKQDKIGSTLIRTALQNYNNIDDKFEFELHGEICKADVRDTWKDGSEISVNIMIGDYDLCVQGFYYPEKDLLQSNSPKGKRALAEKFL